MQGRASVVAAGLVAVLAGCGGDGLGAGGPREETSVNPASPSEVAVATDGAPVEPTAEVVIETFSFGEPTTVQANTSFVVTNNDAAEHTLTADDDSFDAGNLLPGESAEVAVGKPRTVTFHCDIHPDMKGSIEIVG